MGQFGWACLNLTGIFVSNAPTPETLTISQMLSDDVVKYHFVVDGKTEFDLVADGQTRKEVTQDYDGIEVETKLEIKCEDQILVRHETRLATGRWERRITFDLQLFADACTSPFGSTSLAN